MLLKPLGFMRAGGGDPVIDDLPGTATAVFYATVSGSTPVEVGGGVSEWGNLFAGGNDATQTSASNRPSLGVYGSQSCILFDRATSEHLDVVSSINLQTDFLIGIARSATVVNGNIAFLVIADAGSSGVFNGRVDYFGGGGFTNTYTDIFSDGNVFLETESGRPTDWRVMVYHCVGGALSVYVNGALAATRSSARINGNRIRMSGYTNNTNFSDLAVAGLFVATGVTSDTYRQTVQAALAAECGVTLP